MPPRGRPPKPLEMLKATQKDATHKADGRPIPKMEVAPRPADFVIPSPPESLGERGLTEWNKTWSYGFWLHPNEDYHWVEMIANAYDDMTAFRKRIEEDGLIVTGWQNLVAAHPLIAEIRKCEQQIMKCLQVLGFSPSDRARLGIAEAKARTALAEWQDKMANRGTK
jgi:P27 family predicted phage terminase small subunit